MKTRTLIAAVVLAFAAGAVFAGDVAVIVHPTNAQHELSLADLARIFRLDQSHWKSGEKVDLVLQAGVSAKQDVVLARIYHMKADEVQALWLHKVFVQELTAPPRAFASDASVRQYVAANPRAIGYIDAALLDDTVKAVRIDGKLPGDPGYALARESAASPASPLTPTAAPRP